jgi:hypothetical protein
MRKKRKLKIIIIIIRNDIVIEEKEEKKIESKETTRDELKEGKTRRYLKEEKMCTINDNLPLCCSTQSS